MGNQGGYKGGPGDPGPLFGPDLKYTFSALDHVNNINFIGASKSLIASGVTAR